MESLNTTPSSSVPSKALPPAIDKSTPRHLIDLPQIYFRASIDLRKHGSEVTSLSINADFPKGLFVAMSTDKTFHLYDWKDFAGDKLQSRQNH